MVTAHERTLSVWNGQIRPRVKVAGDGPPLVFFHGAYGLRWDPFLAGLAQHHTVYAPEHPGTTPGDPEAIKPLDDLWDLVLYYDELFDQLELEAPPVIGHSFGGLVAAEVAASLPRRVSRLVLLCPLGLWRDDVPLQNALAMAPEAVVKAAFYDPTGPVAAQFLALPEDPDAQIEAQVQLTWTLGCVGKFIWPIPDKGLKKRLHRLQAPTLLVWGRHDGLVPPVYAQEFANRIAHARVELIDRAAHMPHLEQLITVLGLVQAFLTP